MDIFFTYLPISIFGYVDFALFSCSFRSTGEIDGVAKQTVAGHAMANYPCDHFTAVYPDGNFLQISCNEYPFKYPQPFRLPLSILLHKHALWKYSSCIQYNITLWIFDIINYNFLIYYVNSL